MAVAGCEGPKGAPVTAHSFVGDAACIACHQDQQTFEHTAHRLTSVPPSSATIAGSFREGENILTTANPYLHFRMDAREDGYYQTAVMGTGRNTVTIAERIGIVVGSGRKGQSYLYWHGDQLFQLPVSYWTELDHWVTSPGFHRVGMTNFGRAVNPRCLECHATYARTPPEAEVTNQYDTIFLGISCETCHGAGREHVERQSSSAVVRRLAGQAIVNPARLPRERQIDQCALCHGGIGESIRPPFSYVPGEPLEKYVHQRTPHPDEAVDVHGNQVALLGMSPCFQGSEMTCSTCHNVHAPQRDLAHFSATCLACHTVDRCGMFPRLGHQIADNCVSCHMPELPSNTIIASHDGRRIQPRIRTHWIRVYQEAERR